MKNIVLPITLLLLIGFVYSCGSLPPPSSKNPYRPLPKTQKSAVIDSKFEDWRTALHIAAQRGHLEVVQVILKIGAVIYSKNEDGRTALHIAAQRGHLQIVKVLLKTGSVIDSKYEYGRAAHHNAAKGSHLEFVEVLLKIGAVIDSKDEDGRTAFTLLLNEMIYKLSSFSSKSVLSLILKMRIVEQHFTLLLNQVI